MLQRTRIGTGVCQPKVQLGHWLLVMRKEKQQLPSAWYVLKIIESMLENKHENPECEITQQETHDDPLSEGKNWKYEMEHKILRTWLWYQMKKDRLRFGV